MGVDAVAVVIDREYEKHDRKRRGDISLVPENYTLCIIISVDLILDLYVVHEQCFGWAYLLCDIELVTNYRSELVKRLYV